MPDERKLKRGLKDISPLFEGPADETISGRPWPLRGLSRRVISLFCSGQDPNSSQLFNRQLAAHLSQQGRPSTIVTVRSPYSGIKSNLCRPIEAAVIHPPVRHLQIDWDFLEALIAAPLKENVFDPSDSLSVILDFHEETLPKPEKIISLIDQWVFCVEPEMEGLSEAFRMIKASRAVSSRIEYFLIFKGNISFQKGSFLFEGFSQMLARHLGVGVVWLGCLSDQNLIKTAMELLAFDQDSDASRIWEKTPAQLALLHYAGQHLAEENPRYASGV